MDESIKSYAPDFSGEQWSDRDRFLLSPFATNLDGLVHVLRNLPPELTGALCSRASRAADSLLQILLKEYFYPILEGEDKNLANELEGAVEFLRERGFKNILNNQRAQAFYAKWLSQYGDDSIAQMTGTHMVFWGISQVAMKFLEDQRIGLEPIEKSTRYVNFSNKVNGRYLYYIPKPDLERLGFLEEYKKTLDNLFDTYTELLEPLKVWLHENFDEKKSILEKKAFDTLRGLLPMATLGQVAFRGNAQAWEYLINRTRKNPVGELRWLSHEIKTQLSEEIPSLLLRVEDEKSGEYQEYLGKKNERIRQWTKKNDIATDPSPTEKPRVTLIESDADTVEKIITAMLFPIMHISWEEVRKIVDRFSPKEKEEIMEVYIQGRTARWYKVGRAFENAYARFEIVMNIGGYRDLHRHRMMTQARQLFSTHHGYDIPPEIKESGLTEKFTQALDKAKVLFEKIEKEDPELAGYVVPLAYRMRFYQWKNFRQIFWESELRTISQGHPDYRFIEHEMHRLISEKFPMLTRHMQVDMNDYSIARRGTEETIAKKEKDIIEKLKNRQTQ